MEKELREIFYKNNVGFGEIDVDNAVKDILRLFSVSGQLPNSPKKGDYCAVCGSTDFFNDEEE